MTCTTCAICFRQADGSIIKRSEQLGVFVYYLSDGSRTATTPPAFTNASPVDCLLYDNQITPNDHESHMFCVVDAAGDATGQRVMAITTIDPISKIPSVKYYDVATAALWGGDVTTLTTCGTDQQVESDPTYLCDNGTTFIRWVVKEKGEPTGVVYDTDLVGAPYVVTGTPISGDCSDQRVFDYENACFRDPSNIDNPTIAGAVKRATNRATGMVTVEYIDDAGTVLPMTAYKKVACC